jgi:hypothetical protein
MMMGFIGPGLCQDGGGLIIGFSDVIVLPCCCGVLFWKSIVGIWGGPFV